MRLVLQCAMCGTHQPIGTPACSVCRATGVGPLRLMFECPTCGRLDISPVCETCPPLPFADALDFDDGLIVAEEVIEADEPLVVEVEAEELDAGGEYE